MVPVEFELKFTIDPAHLAEVENAVTAAGTSEVMRLRASYFDTADRRLARAHIALRVRREGASWVQTLKCADPDDPMTRFEHNVPRPGRWPAVGPQVDAALHDGTSGGERLRTVIADQSADAQAALERIFWTDVRRRRVVIERPGATIELALDQGSVGTGSQRDSLAELEFELVDGQREVLLEVAREWAGRLPLTLSTISKAQRGGRLSDAGVRGPIKAGSVAIARAMSLDQIARSAGAVYLQAVLANASELLEGNGDPEVLHQLRVALRRMRSMWRAFEPAQGDLGQRMGELSRALGELRDRDIMADVLEHAPQVIAQLDAHAQRGGARDVIALRSSQVLLLDLYGFATLPGASGSETTDVKARPFVRKRLKRLHRQIAGDADGFKTLSMELQHRARKRVKRLRDLVDLTAALFDESPGQSLSKALKQAQAALGTLNDHAVAIGILAEEPFRDEPGVAACVAGLLAERPHLVRKARNALRKVAAADTFW